MEKQFYGTHATINKKNLYFQMRSQGTVRGMKAGED